MAHFRLLLLPEKKSPWCGPCSYIYVGEYGGYGEDKRDPRYGLKILRSEAMSEKECHDQIDGLIKELQALKPLASRFFKKWEEHDRKQLEEYKKKSGRKP
jgi:hypothetical protein